MRRDEIHLSNDWRYIMKFDLPPSKFRWNKFAVLVPILAILLVVVISGATVIDSGERGVRVTLGKVSEGAPLQEGLHLQLPFFQKIVAFSIRTQKFKTSTEAFTKDVQCVVIQSALNYHLDPEQVDDVYRKYGRNIVSLVIEPKVLSVIKDELGSWEAVRLVENREKSAKTIENRLKKELAEHHVVVQAFMYENVDFSNAFESSVERKVVESQNALAQKYVTEQEVEKQKQAVIRAQAEAEAIKLKAQAEAEAIELRANAISKNLNVLVMEAIHKWNGELPQIVGEVGTFFDASRMLKESGKAVKK